MVHTTNSKPMGVAINEHTYKLFMLLWKLRVLGALLDARPQNFKIFTDDGTGFIADAEL